MGTISEWIIGTWVPKEYLVMTEESIEWRPIEAIKDDETLDDESRAFLDTRLLFEADGTLMVLSPVPPNVPKEALDQAVANGEVELYDAATLISNKTTWKEEDGEIYYNIGVYSASVTDPWEKLGRTEECIEWLTCRLAKAE